MGLSLIFWFEIYGCLALAYVCYLLFGIYRRRSNYSFVKGNYGIDLPYSIIEYISYTIAALISPFSLCFILEYFIFTKLHWLANVTFLILSWSVAFMPFFIFTNIIYSSLITKYEIYNRILHTISSMKIENKKSPVNKYTNKTRKGENESKRIYKNEFEKSNFKWIDNPYSVWNGNENVLIIGCGNGLLATWIAAKYIRDNAIFDNSNINSNNNDNDNNNNGKKRKGMYVKNGKVTAVDSWNDKNNENYNDYKPDIYQNSKEILMNNIEKENVKEFVEIIESDLRKLPFKSNTFDIVISCLSISNIMERNNTEYAKVERSKAIKEAFRVAKHGSIIAFYDLFISEEYVRELININDARCIEQTEELPGFAQGHIITCFKV